MRRRVEVLTAAVGEGALLLIIAAIGWATGQPFIFTSLGPTAYELVEKPLERSSKPYNIVVGHLIGLGSGFLAVYLLGAWSAPHVAHAGIVSPARLWAAVLGAVLTTAGIILLKAGQPAAIATSLLVSLGSMQTGRDAAAIVGGVFLITMIGEPLRRLRIKLMSEAGRPSSGTPAS